MGTAGSTATAIKSRNEHLDLTQEWSYYAPDMTVFYEGNPLFGVFSVRNELTALCLVEMTIHHWSPRSSASRGTRRYVPIFRGTPDASGNDTSVPSMI